MGSKRIIVGQSVWTVPDQSAGEILEQVAAAMEGGKVVRLALQDPAGRSVTVFLNGQATPTVVVDEDAEPKPSEISG